MPELNFENDIAIDLDDLHLEWAKHAQTRYDYAVEVAHLDKLAKQQNRLIEVKKTRLTAETSKLILKIKEENSKFTIQQVDAMIANHKDLVPFQRELSNAQEEMINIGYDLNMARNALNAFDDRKYALQDIVKLWIRDYFAAPSEERMAGGGKAFTDPASSEKVRKGRESVNQKRKGHLDDEEEIPKRRRRGK